jgi:hypothetical protein
MNSAASNALDSRILTIRGLRVVLDSELARLYGTTTKAFNQAIKRNASRFPADFAFRLSKQEFDSLRSQTMTIIPGTELSKANWSQIVTSSKATRRGLYYRPLAFTEHGAVMAANVLRSPKAVQMSVYVVRAFIKQRETLAANATIFRKLAEIDKTLLEHNAGLQVLWRRLQPLLAPPPEKPKRKIGFSTGNP